ncbi:cytochrome P450 [Mycena sanguinolenta]|nr:cytochrome P450 [Mycena sanguinolenta]
MAGIVVNVGNDELNCPLDESAKKHRDYEVATSTGTVSTTMKLVAPSLSTSLVVHVVEFIKEMQRLYNPAYVITPGSFLVPKGSQLIAALHSVTVNREHCKDPPTFDPERWGTEAVRRRYKYAYIPFAADQCGRGCIGFNFALQEIKNVPARVALNFKIENTTEGAVIYDAAFFLYRPLKFRMWLH